jgi:hypothetical protein
MLLMSDIAAPPEIGEQTDEVLAEFGFSAGAGICASAV